MKYLEADKGRISSTFQEKFPKPAGMTKLQVKKALMEVWDDDMFWFQCADRFGLFSNSLTEIDPKTMEHAAQNYWGMLRDGVRPTT